MPDRHVRFGTLTDVTYLAHLQDHLHDAVGFIPRGGLKHRVNTRRLIVVEENDAPAGYVTFTRRRDGLVHVPQICVDQAIWRTTAGTQLVTLLRSLALASGARALTLRSARELECNRFWPTQGFTRQGVIQGRRRELLCWALPLDGHRFYPVVEIPTAGGIPARNPRTRPKRSAYAKPGRSARFQPTPASPC